MKFGFIVPHLGCFGSIREIIELGNALVEYGHEVTIHHPEGTPCVWLPCKASVTDLSFIEGYDLLLMVTEWRMSDYELLMMSEAKMKGVILMGFAPSKDFVDALAGWPHSPKDGNKVLSMALHNPDLYLFADGS